MALSSFAFAVGNRHTGELGTKDGRDDVRGATRVDRLKMARAVRIGVQALGLSVVETMPNLGNAQEYAFTYVEDQHLSRQSRVLLRNALGVLLGLADVAFRGQSEHTNQKCIAIIFRSNAILQLSSALRPSCFQTPMVPNRVSGAEEQ